MRVLRAIAGITFRETGRQPTTWIITLVTFMLILILPYFMLFGMGMENELLKEMGLGSITLATIVVALLGAANTITRELEGRTILTLLSKPVSRSQVVIGKYLGLLAMLGTVTLVLMVSLVSSSIIYHATASARGSTEWSRAASEWRDAQVAKQSGQTPGAVDPADDDEQPQTQVAVGVVKAPPLNPYKMPGQGDRILYSVGQMFWLDAPGLILGAWLGFLATAVISAVLVAGSTFLPVAANAVPAMVVFLTGNLMDLIDASLADSPLVQGVVRVLVPNLRLFDVSDTFARGLPLPWDFALWGSAVALAYVVAIITIGCLALQRRDVG